MTERTIHLGCSAHRKANWSTKGSGACSCIYTQHLMRLMITSSFTLQANFFYNFNLTYTSRPADLTLNRDLVLLPGMNEKEHPHRRLASRGGRVSVHTPDKLIAGTDYHDLTWLHSFYILYDPGKWKCWWKSYSVSLNLPKCQRNNLICAECKVLRRNVHADHVLFQPKNSRTA